MAQKILSVVVTGTGFEGRAEIIRAHCLDGSEVELRREPSNPHDPEAIAVWLKCSSFFGLFKSIKKIGYIKAARADSLAPKLDSGKLSISRAFVRSFYAPAGARHPRVSLQIEAVEH